MLKIFILTLLALFAYDTSQDVPTNCKEALSVRPHNGIHQIQLQGFNNITNYTLFVYCEADTKGGDPWNIVQRRKDGSINFFRVYWDYRYGFGNMNYDFFLGLEHLHALTHSAVHELWVRLEDWNNIAGDAYYDSFAIDNAEQYFALYILGRHSGDATDAMRNHEGMMFSAKDFDNDVHDKIHCAKDYKGGWWYNGCLHSNLNGLYLGRNMTKAQTAQGVCWLGFSGGHDYSLKYVHMAIRPVIS